MTNNYVPYNQNQAYQPYQATQYFPQPQGSIYMIGSSNDVNNVPVGAGLSAAICLREGIIYLKTIQNGSPMLVGYRLSPLESSNTTQDISIQTQVTSQSCGIPPQENIESRILTALENLESRLAKLEKSAEKPKHGGKTEWPI